MSLIEFLRKNKSKARKIFGERELKIIEKQLFGISLTQSEKNRLSRDIRKKFEFIKDAGKFENEFGLKYGAQIKEIIEDAKEFILNSKYFSRVKKIILFGSTIEGKRTFRSDIDMAVEFNKINSKEAAEFRVYVSGRVNELVDIQVYNVLPEKVQNEIDAYGRVIYKK